MRILVLGDFTHPKYHPMGPVFDIIKTSLEREGIFVDASEERSILTKERLSPYDVIFMYYDAPDEHLGEQAIDVLTGFVASGKGLVVVHCGVLFADEALHRLVGAKFITHPPYQRLPIEVTEPNHPVTKGVDNFEIDDELYMMQAVGPDDREILLKCTLEGKVQPVAWTRTLGKGRIVYHALGHSEASFNNPAFMQLISNSLRWAGREA